jgi:4-hydroxy-2-oxoheptanedioate aldolase
MGGAEHGPAAFRPAVSEMQESPTMSLPTHRERRDSRGVWCQTRDVNTVRRLAAAGFDWLVLDAQHGDVDRSALVELGRALGDVDFAFGVRVAELDFGQIGAALDAGASTIIVPQIDTADEARAVVDATFYPPTGSRSRGPFAALWGGPTTEPAAANAAVTCAVMIESAEALGNVEEIAAVSGLQMLFVGPHDLSLSLGIDVGELVADGGPMARIAAAAEANELALGAFAGDLDRAREFREAGVQFLVVATDGSVLRAGAAAILDAVT